ncbi:MAG TPA: hypothetical protein VJP80_04295 [Candidatus Saccharimonadales bacterium]|nr:hypothetical protein [Candidatus Saccharimonadales bacterium]
MSEFEIPSSRDYIDKNRVQLELIANGFERVLRQDAPGRALFYAPAGRPFVAIERAEATPGLEATIGNFAFFTDWPDDFVDDLRDESELFRQHNSDMCQKASQMLAYPTLEEAHAVFRLSMYRSILAPTEGDFSSLEVYDSRAGQEAANYHLNQQLEGGVEEAFHLLKLYGAIEAVRWSIRSETPADIQQQCERVFALNPALIDLQTGKFIDEVDLAEKLASLRMLGEAELPSDELDALLTAIRQEAIERHTATATELAMGLHLPPPEKLEEIIAFLYGATPECNI